jgi:hypothetical protein
VCNETIDPKNFSVQIFNLFEHIASLSVILVQDCGGQGAITQISRAAGQGNLSLDFECKSLIFLKGNGTFKTFENGTWLTTDSSFHWLPLS